MKRWLKLSLSGAVLVAAACGEQPSAPTQQGPEFSAASPSFANLFASPGAHVHVLPPRVPAFLSEAGKLGGGGGKGTGIYYHGGPIISSPRIAAIYWSATTIYSGGPAPGTTGSGSSDGSLVGLFMRSLGGTGYWNINSTYTDGTGTHVGNVLAYTQFWADNTDVPASGSSVSDAAVQAEVVKGLDSGALTYDASTLYAVFSANGVNLGGGFGTQYCAYHGHFTWNGNDVKYAVMPYDAQYPSACTDGTGISPTSDFPAAAEVNTLAHETEETATDEDLNAWYDRRGYENADKCAWNFGATSKGSTGTYNETIGGVNWLIQMNWVNANSGGCVQHWP
jgi:hypothetical protein